MAGQPEVAWAVGAELGEGPLWVERDQALWFTDIKARRIHRFDPSDGSRRSWDSPGQPGFIVAARSGGFIVGLDDGLHRFDPRDSSFALLAAIEPDRPQSRLNDSVVDPQGRLWFGTMDDGEREAAGSYYCFHSGAVRPTGISGVAITNGPAVSPDGTRLYWVDTLRGTIHACPIGEDGTLGPSERLIRIDPADGHPDGPTVDGEGAIWIALYSGWEARRYSPEGDLLARVRFPTANITKVAFGGPGLRTGFATSARHLLSDRDRAAQPLSGALFTFDPGVAGIAGTLVAD